MRLQKKQGLQGKMQKYFDALIKVITNALKEKKQVYIRYFGYFYPLKVKAMKLKNNFVDGVLPEHTRYCFTFTNTFIKNMKKAESDK